MFAENKDVKDCQTRIKGQPLLALLFRCSSLVIAFKTNRIFDKCLVRDLKGSTAEARRPKPHLSNPNDSELIFRSYAFLSSSR